MNLDFRHALNCCSEFAELQEILLRAWLLANSMSRDFDLLLDFPKCSKLNIRGCLWTASRHGCGVRFLRQDGLEVDIPFGIASPHEFDANRVFDFYMSKSKGALDSPSEIDRPSWYSTIEKLIRDKVLLAYTDSLGRRILQLPKNA